MTPTKGKVRREIERILKDCATTDLGRLENYYDYKKEHDKPINQLLSLFKKTLDSVRLEKMPNPGTFSTGEIDRIRPGYNQAVKEQSKLIERALK